MKKPHFPRPRRGSRQDDLGTAIALAREDLEALAVTVGSLRTRLDEGEGGEGLAAAHLAAFQELAAAKVALDVARTPVEVADAVARLAMGSRMLSVVEAALDGRPLPEDRRPCLFDPAHGSSTQDVLWASTRYGTHPVPVCGADAALLAEHRPPRIRLAGTPSGPEPYWDAAPAYFSGHFSGHPALAWLTDPGHAVDHDLSGLGS